MGGFFKACRAFNWESNRRHLVRFIWTSLVSLRPFDFDKWTAVLECLNKPLIWLRSPWTG